MKIKIITFSLLCSILILLTPCVNAVEFNEVKDEYSKQIEKKIQNLQLKISNMKNVMDLSLIILIYLIGFVIEFTIVFIAIFALFSLEPKPPPSLSDWIFLISISLLSALFWPLIFLLRFL